MSQFNMTPAGVVMPDSQEVLQQVQAWWLAAMGNQLNTDPATPQGQIMASEAAAIQDKNSQLLYLSQMFNPLTAEGQWQDALARIYFLSRQPARATVVDVLCTGLPGVIIPGPDADTPAQVSTQDGQTLTCQQGGAIGLDGTVTLPFALDTPGAVEIPADAVNGIVTTIPGWDTAENPAAGITGQELESQAAFEQRRYASVALNARSVAGAVFAEVGQLDGVLDVVVRQNRGDAPVVVDGVTLGAHSIYVCALGGEDAAIAQAIYDSVSAGCDYNGNTSVEVTDTLTGAVETVTFTRPTAMRVGVRVTIGAGATAGTTAAIQAAVVANFYGESAGTTRVRMGSDLYASRFYCPLNGAGYNIVSIDVADLGAGGAWGATLHIPMNYAPALASEDVTVVEA